VYVYIYSISVPEKYIPKNFNSHQTIAGSYNSTVYASGKKGGIILVVVVVYEKI